LITRATACSNQILGEKARRARARWVVQARFSIPIRIHHVTVGDGVLFDCICDEKAAGVPFVYFSDSDRVREQVFKQVEFAQQLRSEILIQNRSMDKPKVTIAVFAWIPLAVITSCQSYIDHLPHRYEVNAVLRLVSRSFHQFPKEVLD
jgi:hypothetical protein